MDISILFFGMATDLAGNQYTSFPLNKSIGLEEFKNMLFEKHPDMKQMHQFAIAINEEYADEDAVINPGDIIAIIPPVSGG